MSDRKAMMRVSAVQPMTPHNQALYKAGEKLLIDSLETGREFCKFMVTTSMAAIPAYLALVKMLLPKEAHISTAEGIVVLLPTLLFLIAAVIAIVGYFPKKAEFSLDLPDDINRVRSATIGRRRNYAVAGVIAFALGAILGSALVVWVPHWFPPAPKDSTTANRHSGMPKGTGAGRQQRSGEEDGNDRTR